MANPESRRTPNGTPAPTPMSIDVLDGDDGLGEGVAKIGKVLGKTEDVELLDSAGGSLADAKDVRTVVEIKAEDDMTSGNCDAEVEPLISASDMKKE